jgi:glycosyltransferase involved in cell wall biosynthesis
MLNASLNMPSSKDLELQPKVMVWRETLLPFSETFVWNKNYYSKFDAQLVGMVALPNYRLSENQSVFMSSKFQRVKFRIDGRNKNLERFIKENKFDLIHAHFGWDAISIFRLSRRLKIPLIVSLHGYDVLSLTTRKTFRGIIYRVISRWVLPKVERILCTSDFVRQRAINLFGLKADRTFTHYIGSETFSDIPKPESRNGVLFVGRLVKQKGAMILLEAMYALRNKLPSTPLTILGDGPCRTVLEEYSKEHGLSVDFEGAVNHDVVSKHMRTARLIVVPSTTIFGDEPEGLGMVVVEALANGLPCIAFRNGGIPEVLVGQEDSMLTDDGDSLALAMKMEALYKNQQLLEKLAEQGLERHRLMFNEKIQNSLLLDHYRAARIAWND